MSLTAASTKPPTSLLDLPTELRYEIYSYLVTPGRPSPFYPGTNTASVRVRCAFKETPSAGLLLSCRRIHAEYQHHFHESATLELRIHIWPPPVELPFFLAQLADKHGALLARTRHLDLAITNVPRWTNPSDAAGYLCTPFPEAVVELCRDAMPGLRTMTVGWSEVYLFFCSAPVGIAKVAASFEPLGRLARERPGVRVRVGEVQVRQSLPSLHTPPGAKEVEGHIRGAIEAAGETC